MDGIQPYGGGPHPHPVYLHPHQAHGYPSAGHTVAGYHPAHPPAGALALPPKGPADYLRGIARRAWLVLAVSIPVAVAGILLVLRMPAVYRVEAEIMIEPPKYDRFLTEIINPGSHPQTSSDEQDKYVPDKLNLLRSRPLADKVVRMMSESDGQPISPLEDPAADIVKNMTTKPRPGSHHIVVTLDGSDPGKVTRTLNHLIEEFKSQSKTESQEGVELSKSMAQQSLATLDREIKGLTEQIHEVARTSAAIAPGGINLPKERYISVEQQIRSKEMNYGDLLRTVKMSARLAPDDPRAGARMSRVAKLEDELANIRQRYLRVKRAARDKSDPALRTLYDDYKRVLAEIEDIQRPGHEPERVDDADVILASAQAEIDSLKAERDRHLGDMRDSLPAFDRYLVLESDRDLKQKQKATTKQKLSEFESLAKGMKDPVKVTVPPTEPILPDRPRKGLYIAVLLVFSLMLGMGLAGFVEHLDNSVKVPEHLTIGLMLPLLGVVPRIKRTAKLDRGGHLWTPGVPDSIEADAYRNLRASLLGVAGTHGPMVTLLVTSAKAGEGKSTTALNLAATCARAGERTLLVDVDLRRPSLADVFPHEQEHLGLVDVLRGDLPWQRVVVSTDLPNLDFIPTGETRDVPIEILGSLELRQLLLSLSQHHYDRVILDGPAVLGLADCRMLGRIVDAAVMVVRYGARELRPLRRAKGVLEQSRVPLVGVIFNGLSDDLENWSSYGPSPTPFGGPAPEAPLPALDGVRPGPAAGLPVAP
jgi:polysaccharide biosynthesis transport protein